MSILVINAGSTSLKYKLFNNQAEEIKQGIFENIKNHLEALKLALRQIGDLREVQAVGHRVVHGGDKFFEPLLVDELKLEEIKQFNHLAPLHNPYNLAAIKAAIDYLPNVPQIAVFDTAFYSNLPNSSRYYALPLEITERYKIYRYGFHGISHKYAMLEAAAKLKKNVDSLNLITCHLGGGWSITAIKNGLAVDTSMGWTPLEGLVMMTRAGDLDPAIVLNLLKLLPGEINRDKVDQIYDLLNNQSGIKGLTGFSDFQLLLKNVCLGDADSCLAFDIALNRLVKYIGAYWLELEGKVDAIVFTGAIGAGNPYTRNHLIKKIKCLGDLLYLTIKTDEELMIAKEVIRIIKSAKIKA